MADAALSTMWAIGRFPGLGAFFAAAGELGFDRVELNHAVTPAMLEGVSLEGVRIASIHEPCPAEISVHDLQDRDWLVSSPDEDNRRRAVAIARRSIDLARSIGAGVVVIHVGRVNLDPALQKAVVETYGQGPSGAPEHRRAKDLLREARADRAEVHMRSVRRSLLELAGYASGRGVRLGVENRDHYPEIPLADELDDLLSADFGDAVGYWHDVGHAQVLENLGFGAHRDWLRRFGDRILGVHLHDVDGIRDHRAAGQGGMDWDMVAGGIPEGALRTCEFRNDWSPEEVASGLHHLVQKGCIMERRRS